MKVENIEGHDGRGCEKGTKLSSEEESFTWREEGT